MADVESLGDEIERLKEQNRNLQNELAISRTRLKTEVAETLRLIGRIGVLNEERELARAATKKLAEGLETLREFMLEYDAADDKRGSRWDGVRIAIDRAMRESITALRALAE